MLCHAVSGFFLLLLLPGAHCAWRRPAVARGWRGVGAVESSKISPPPPGGRRESSKTRRVSVVVLRTTTLTRDMSRVTRVLEYSICDRCRMHILVSSVFVPVHVCQHGQEHPTRPRARACTSGVGGHLALVPTSHLRTCVDGASSAGRGTSRCRQRRGGGGGERRGNGGRRLCGWSIATARLGKKARGPMGQVHIGCVLSRSSMRYRPAVGASRPTLHRRPRRRRCVVLVPPSAGAPRTCLGARGSTQRAPTCTQKATCTSLHPNGPRCSDPHHINATRHKRHAPLAPPLVNTNALPAVGACNIQSHGYCTEILLN